VTGSEDLCVQDLGLRSRELLQRQVRRPACSHCCSCRLAEAQECPIQSFKRHCLLSLSHATMHASRASAATSVGPNRAFSCDVLRSPPPTPCRERLFWQESLTPALFFWMCSGRTLIRQRRHDGQPDCRRCIPACLLRSTPRSRLSCGRRHRSNPPSSAAGGWTCTCLAAPSQAHINKCHRELGMRYAHAGETSAFSLGAH
jgi:hypothetical protein